MTHPRQGWLTNDRERDTRVRLHVRATCTKRRKQYRSRTMATLKGFFHVGTFQLTTSRQARGSDSGISRSDSQCGERNHLLNNGLSRCSQTSAPVFDTSSGISFSQTFHSHYTEMLSITQLTLAQYLSRWAQTRKNQLLITKCHTGFRYRNKYEKALFLNR